MQARTRLHTLIRKQNRAWNEIRCCTILYHADVSSSTRLSCSTIRLEHKVSLVDIPSSSCSHRSSASDLEKMYLGLTDLIKGLLTFNVSAKNKDLLTNSKDGDHYYARGNITDRGPCPGLNSPSNSGYLFVHHDLIRKKDLTPTALAMAKTSPCLKSKEL
jgi:hypothetical protein